MMGGLFQLFWGRGRDLQELGCHAFFLSLVFWSLMVILGMSWQWWVCHLIYANVFWWVYNAAQGPLQVRFSAILDLVGSNQFFSCLVFMLDFPGGSGVMNLPAMQEPQEIPVWFLGWEDPLEEGMATHLSILAWRIPRTEESGGL